MIALLRMLQFKFAMASCTMSLKHNIYSPADRVFDQMHVFTQQGNFGCFELGTILAFRPRMPFENSYRNLIGRTGGSRNKFLWGTDTGLDPRLPKRWPAWFIQTTSFLITHRSYDMFLDSHIHTSSIH